MIPPLRIVRAPSIDDALARVSLASPTVDGAIPRRRFVVGRIAEAMTSGHRRPEWVWSVEGPDGTQLGLLAALGLPGEDRPLVIDLHDCPADAGAAAALYQRVHDDVRALDSSVPVEMVVHGAATEVPDELPGMGRIIEAAASAGSRILVRRTTMERPAADLAATRESGLVVDEVDPADPRLLPLMTEVVRHSDDVIHQRDREQVGLEEAARSSLEVELGLAGEHTVLLAEVHGQPAGLAIARWVEDRGLVAFVGIAEDHAGQGHGHQLLGHTLHLLARRGARTLVGDADNPNTRMMHLFRTHGFRPSASRIDFVAD